MRLLVTTLLSALLLSSCASAEDDIRAAIDEANHCETKSDCDMVYSRCPFDCYVLVNGSESERIHDLIHGYASKCEYGCTEPPDFDCVENKCIFLR